MSAYFMTHCVMVLGNRRHNIPLNFNTKGRAPVLTENYFYPEHPRLDAGLSVFVKMDLCWQALQPECLSDYLRGIVGIHDST